MVSSFSEHRFSPVEKKSGTLRDYSYGFGMIEVVVSILLLAVLSLTLVPVLAQSIRISQLNSRIASASQLVSVELHQLNSNVSTCNDLMTWIYDRTATLKTISTGETLQANVSADGWQDCFGLDYPAAISVRVSVNNLATGDLVSSAYSLVNLDSE